MSLPLVKIETALAKAELMVSRNNSAIEYVNTDWPEMEEKHPVLAMATKELVRMVAQSYHKDTEVTAEDIIEAPTTVPMMVLAIYLVDLLTSAAEIEELEGGEV